MHRNIISIVEPTRCTNVSNFILFWNDTPHVSDGLTVHHQEFKTVHTATGICQTDTAVCLQAGPLASRQQYLTNACRCMYNLEFQMMDGKTVRDM